MWGGFTAKQKEDVPKLSRGTCRFQHLWEEVSSYWSESLAFSLEVKCLDRYLSFKWRSLSASLGLKLSKNCHISSKSSWLHIDVMIMRSVCFPELPFSTNIHKCWMLKIACPHLQKITSSHIQLNWCLTYIHYRSKV